MSVVTVKHREKILHLETSFKTSKKDSLQRKRQTDGMYSNKWVGVMYVKHMSKDTTIKRNKLKPGDPCSGKVTDVSFLYPFPVVNPEKPQMYPSSMSTGHQGL